MKTKFSYILRALISILVWQHSAHAQTVSQGKGCLEADVLMVVDWSGSVADKQEYMEEAIIAYSRSFSLSDDGIKFGVVSFGDITTVHTPLTADTASIDHGILELMNDVGNHNSICDAVPSVASDLFIQSAEQRGKIPQRRFLIFVSDGDVQRKYTIRAQFRALAERQNITICAITLEGNVDDKEGAKEFMSYIADPNYLFHSSYGELREFLVTINLCM
jgi:hypothetical protein